MPTFDQIESLQTQCYIHKKTGWEIESLQYGHITADNHVFQIFFIKRDPTNLQYKAAFIIPNGDIIWGDSVEIDNAWYKVGANEWTETEFYQWVYSHSQEKLTIFNPRKSTI